MVPSNNEPAGLIASWGTVEWWLGAAWICGVAVAGFMWRVALKVALLDQQITTLENIVEKNDSDTERRHQENVHVIRNLTARIDGLMVGLRQSRFEPPDSI